jgi:hypothetical protein
VPPVAEAITQFDWMPQSDRDLVAGCILEFVQRAFTVFWRPAEHLETVTPEAFRNFIKWVESLPDFTVVAFCWDLLLYDPSWPARPVLWLKWSGRLSGAISYDCLRMAVGLAEEAEAMFWWSKERWSVMKWDAASPPYMELLHHSSYLVRSAASSVLGRLFFGIQTEGDGRGAPSLSQMLTIVQDLEVKTAGIAGPFLQGANWGIETDEWAEFGGDFDMKSWFIETLRESGRELHVPHLQTLEFYAHELFAFDANAIRAFLEMGRKGLAVMTATEEPSAIPELLPVLNEMAASNDPAVALAMREYLSVRSHHAGLNLYERLKDSRK